MKSMKSLLLLIVVAVLAACGPKYKYETVADDPIGARIYTLDNGLKIYMAVNKEEPRIQTYIAVKVGAKNDPAETTGLAHYFEHLMFKGTHQFGTTDYAAEEPMLDRIEELFEEYRMTSDEAQRAAIYHQIDSVSYEASKLAIPNEYDKLMSAIGADGTNAYTGYDQTVYVENIPSNQIDNWAMIQADRFRNATIRGFHTELETIYEEKNMSLTQDRRKVSEVMLSALFPNHPYGQQTVLGTQEHLKNPSITNVKNYHATWYVPNNMAICLSGDFDPDEMIAVIDKYFGDMKPNADLPKLTFPAETPITTPVVKEVYGLDAPNITLAWRSQGAADPRSDVASLAGSIIYNGMAGLIDIDLNQQQKALFAGGGVQALADYGIFTLMGAPKQGQSLDEVRELLLAEVGKLRRGEFDGALLEAAINNYKVGMMEEMDSNNGRADAFVNSFIDGMPWKDVVTQLERMSLITKEDVVTWANENLTDQNYVAIYKQQGPDPDERKMPKPAITPIVTNRDAVSDFLKGVQLAPVTPIEPLFVDYARDMAVLEGPSGIPVLYKKNETNGLFTLNYIFETGTDNNPLFGLMNNYIDYLGTADKSSEQIKSELYNIACSYSIGGNRDRMSVTISGLGENMARAMELFEEYVAGIVGNEDILAAVKDDTFKSRENAKAAQNANASALNNYVVYGPEYIRQTTLTNADLAKVTSEQLIGAFKDLMNLEHRVAYYGPMDEAGFLAELGKHHRVGELKPAGEKKTFKPLLTPDNKVCLAQYDAAQIRYLQMSNRGDIYNTANDAIVTLYNEYFGGGMNGIVFQEMREARGLAYQAGAYLSSPRLAGDAYTFAAQIATQNDKMSQAIDAFEEIIDDMPASEAAFRIAKDAIIQRIRTQRTIKAGVLNSYIAAQDKGVDYDLNRDVFEKVQGMSLADVVAFQQQWIKDRTYSFGILGDIKALDIDKLLTLGPVRKLSQEEIFGY